MVKEVDVRGGPGRGRFGGGVVACTPWVWVVTLMWAVRGGDGEMVVAVSVVRMGLCGWPSM